MDWIASFITMINVWLLGEQNKYGWLFGMAGNVLWVVYALWMTWQVPLAILNVVFFGLNVRGYKNWSEEGVED
jgi:nicotinamide riboside transporter PnuC